METERSDEVMEAKSRERSGTEIVILVHGTFAGELSDVGENWWQENSDVWDQFRSLLPDQVSLDDVFHWGIGTNSYRARFAAGEKLLDRLLEFERDNRVYHLVGHSHGGSVIWECLRLATYRYIFRLCSKKDAQLLRLRKLASWTTVGTPFIDFGSNALFRKPKPGMGIEGRRLRQLWSPISHRLLSLAVRLYGALLWVMLIGSIVIPLGIFSGLDFGVDGLWDEFEDTGGVWIIASSVFAFLYIFVIGGALVRNMEIARLKEERNSAVDTLKRFGNRWLGIYSQYDEAIAALSAAVHLKLDIVKEREVVSPLFHSGSVLVALKLVRQIMNSIFNLTVRRIGNRFISSQISTSILGNDRSGAKALSVRPHPGTSELDLPPLPDTVDQELLKLADCNAAETIPKIRTLLYDFGEGPLHLQAENQGNFTDALVHNNYFKASEIIELIVQHIKMSGKHNMELARLEPWVEKWIGEFKESFAKCL